MPQPDHRVSLGQQGEELACRRLRQRGYAVLARRYRTRYGEIDIVARDGDTMVFVEVKTRKTASCGAPAEAVTPLKRRRLASMASDYLARHPPDARGVRFDVVAIRVDGDGNTQVDVIPNAFTLDDCGRT